MAATTENQFIAEKLNEVADLLEQQQASGFRVSAYRDAAQFLLEQSAPIRTIYEVGGRKSLEKLPTIGQSIAAAITELLETGRLAQIERLRGSLDPEHLFRTVPMIGKRLAEDIHDALGIDTLEALEAAAHDGSLKLVPGIGERRLRGIQHSLTEMLARRRTQQTRPVEPPPIAETLDVDREYQKRSQDGTLSEIAPRRFNPTGTLRIPILHTERGAWHFTALFSNTANAHRLGRTTDWVIIFYQRDGGVEGQCTVVTERKGPWKGHRVIRGHETASAAFQNSFRQIGAA